MSSRLWWDPASSQVADARDDSSVLATKARQSMRSKGTVPNAIVKSRLQGGLALALRSLADETTGPLELDIELDGRLPQVVEATAYAVVAELSAEVGDGADANLEVRITRADAQLLLSARSSVPAHESLLERLRDRVGAAGGELPVFPQPGRGMRLQVELPCA